MNKHIELVKKWIANPKSVTREELKASAEAAAVSDAAHADAVYVAAYSAADAAYNYAAATVDVAYAAAWVKRYEELTNE